MGRWIGGEADETEGLVPPHDRNAAGSPSTTLRVVPLPIRKGERGGDSDLSRAS